MGATESSGPSALVTPRTMLATCMRGNEMASVSQPPLFTFEKRCPNCGKVKLFHDFSPHLSAKSKLAYHCRACRLAANRRKYAESAEVRDQVRFNHKLKTYGITREQYEAMLTEQGGLCAICRQVPTNSKGFAVDHDHDTGKVRGLLCGTCNSGIAHLQDNPQLLEEAAAYLRRYGK